MPPPPRGSRFPRAVDVQRGEAPQPPPGPLRGGVYGRIAEDDTAPIGGPPGKGAIVTTSEGSTSRQLDRWSGGCLIVAGLLLLPVALHPDVFESTFAHVALDSALWVPMHAALVVAMILSLVGLLGLYGRHAGELGRLGAVGFGMAVTGMVVAACAFFWEAFLLPPIAREAPGLLAWDGPVVTDWGVRASALGGLWVIGLAVLGVPLARNRVVPRAAALTLTLSALAFAVLAGPFVPVLGPLSTLAFAGGYAWVGAALWAGASGRRQPPEQRSRPTVPAGTGRGRGS